MGLFGVEPVAYLYPNAIVRQAEKVIRARRVNCAQVDEKRLVPLLKKQVQEDQGMFVKEKEIAWLGRSNVGKSSLMNSVLQEEACCRTAKRPGTTRELHFHGLAVGKGLMVDVPGYGFARMNIRRRQLWLGSVFEYLRISSRVCKVFLLINGEHGALASDLEVMKRLDPLNLQFQLVLTKVDKLEQDQFWRRGLALGQVLSKFQFRNLSPVLLFASTKTGFGVDTLRQAVLYSLQTCQQRDIDGKEQMLLQYLDQKRVMREQIDHSKQVMVRHHEIKRLFYASKYSRHLK